MIKIPLKAIPNQQMQIVLNDQSCTIHVYQRGDYLYLDLTCDGVAIRRGAICLPGVNIPLYKSADFSGMIFFADLLNGGGTPNWQELGSRYILCYDGAEDVQ